MLTVVRDSASPWGGDWDETGMIYFTSAHARIARVAAGGGVVEMVSQLDSASGVSEHDWVQRLPGGKLGGEHQVGPVLLDESIEGTAVAKAHGEG